MAGRLLSYFAENAFVLTHFALAFGLGRLGFAGGLLQVSGFVLLQIGRFQIQKARSPRLTPRPWLQLLAESGPLRPAELPKKKVHWKDAAPMLINASFYEELSQSSLMMLWLNSIAWLVLKVAAPIVQPERSVAYGDATLVCGAFLFAIVFVALVRMILPSAGKRPWNRPKRGAGP